MNRLKLVVSTALLVLLAHSLALSADPDSERTVKAFHRWDFDDVGRVMRESPGATVSISTFGWNWTALFDGDENSSLLMSPPQPGGSLFPGPASATEPTDHVLLTLENPAVDEAGAAIVGRWSAPGYMGGAAYAPELILEAEHTDGKTTSSVARPRAKGQSTLDYDDFRLPITGEASSRVRRLTLKVSTRPGIDLVFEDLRLVENADTAEAVVSPPPAGVPSPGLVPSARADVDRYDPDGWANDQNAIAPVRYAPATNASAASLSFCRRRADGSPRHVRIASMDAPPLDAGAFGVTGTVNYYGLDGKGDFDGSAYFELTAFFPDGTTEKVGTTAAFGPSRLMTGHSGDRPMELAIHSAMKPTRWQLELVSDGVGQVAFSNLSIVQFEPPVIAASAGGVRPHSLPWTDQRIIQAAGWGALGASVLLAVVVMLAPGFGMVRGAGPIVMLVIGEALFAWAMFLVGRREAAAHVVPLFAGAVAWVVPVVARWVVVRRVHERELRKMLTIDAG